MKIVCLLFGKYAELAGIDRMELELPDGSDVGEALRELRKSLPQGELIPQSSMVAVNQAHALSGQVLQTGDELALLPPLAGG
jgi:molybdopterin converting factor small subunit